MPKDKFSVEATRLKAQELTRKANRARNTAIAAVALYHAQRKREEGFAPVSDAPADVLGVFLKRLRTLDLGSSETRLWPCAFAVDAEFRNWGAFVIEFFPELDLDIDSYDGHKFLQLMRAIAEDFEEVSPALSDWLLPADEQEHRRAVREERLAAMSDFQRAQTIARRKQAEEITREQPRHYDFPAGGDAA